MKIRLILIPFLFFVSLVGCDVDVAIDSLPLPITGTGAPDGVTDPVTATPAVPGEEIRIASFNIQVFGQSKLEHPKVMATLTKIVRLFDVVAIQEIRSKEQDVLPRFVKLLNADGSHYDFVIGPRLGRSSSKEQYAFVFDTSRIELIPNSTYTVKDPYDDLHREPFVGRFRARGLPAADAFNFSLVNIHTDPDETDTELDALADAFVTVQNDESGEDDVILLGDLNVSEYDLGRLGKLPGIHPAITGVMTNTRRTKAYDNIVFESASTTEFTGRSGVLDFPGMYDLTSDEALDVSDHLPVWAIFSTREGVGRVAAATTDSSRSR